KSMRKAVSELMRTTIVSFLVLLFANSVCLFAQDYRITDFGARPEPAHINTMAINKAIETCAKEGGGRVVIPKGIFETGTILLKQNVDLHFEMGSTLLASPELDNSVEPISKCRSTFCFNKMVPVSNR